MVRKKSLETELRWRGVMNRQSGSGLSIREFCAQEGISQPSFYAWRRKLREQESNGRRFRKSKDLMSASNRSAFIPLKLLDSTGTMEVVHPLGCRVRVSGTVNAVALKQVLDVLNESGRT